MKRFIGIMLIAVILIVGALGGIALADSSGRLSIKDGEGYWYKWTMSAVGNTSAWCNPNGETNEIGIVFTNTGDAEKTVWIQDADKGPKGIPIAFVNVTATAITVNPADTDSFRYRTNTLSGPCWRLHTTDTDLGIANKLTGKIKLIID